MSDDTYLSVYLGVTGAGNEWHTVLHFLLRKEKEKRSRSHWLNR